MEIEKERNGKESVMVVLDGTKASTGKSGVAPLVWALRDLVGSDDEVLVLAILKPEAPSPSPNAICCYLGEKRNNHPTEGNPCIDFLDEEISQRKEAYMKILRPYYNTCKSSGVKFQVKFAADFQPEATIVDKANNAKVTWIVMDSCFARDQSFLLSETNCNISFVGDDEEAIVHRHMPPTDESETSATKELKPNKKCSSLGKKLSKMTVFEGIDKFSPSSHRASTSREGEILTMVDPSEGNENFEKTEITRKDPVNVSFKKFSEVNLVLRQPMQLSWEVLTETTGGFGYLISSYQCENSKFYSGYLTDHQSNVLVRRFSGSFNGILEAEKKAALYMYHKHIVGLLGYHHNEYETILVYPFPQRGSLDRFLYGSMGKQAELSFQEKLKIVVGIAQGVRYMHEECPRGPIVHGDLRPCNIFLTHDLEPLITGFGRATWMQLERPSLVFRHRCSLKHPSEVEKLVLVKSDILSYGILLLRLFCKRSAPQHDNNLIEWARPFLQQKAYHELLDEDTDDLDIYGIYRVMFVAAQCTKIKPLSRPCMSEVICLLRAETSCAVISSPSSEGSPYLDLNMNLT